MKSEVENVVVSDEIVIQNVKVKDDVIIVCAFRPVKSIELKITI